MLHLKIIPETKSCPDCNSVLIFPKYKDLDFYYYCYQCFEWINWRKGTILKRTTILYTNFERLLLLFVQNKSTSDAISFFEDPLLNFQLSKSTVKKYFSMFSDITFSYYKQRLNATMLEGRVELDETLVFKPKKTKAKRHRCYNLPATWLVGMIERDTKKFIIIPVLVRNDSSLISIILKYIKSRSIIYTDCHSVYVNNRIFQKESRLVDYGYNHYYVDHSKEFVSSEFDHIHTNTIERLWKSIKTDLRKKHITKGYMKAIARFYFHANLNKDQQVKFISDTIMKCE